MPAPCAPPVFKFAPLRVICIMLGFLGLFAFSITAEAEFPQVFGEKFTARDTLDVAPDPSVDAQTCLEGLRWSAGSFEIECSKPLEWRYDSLVRFPSAIQTGDAVNDRVAMEWHMARDGQGEIVRAPAVIVVHESGRGMTVGRMFALLLSRHQLHTFMIQLPGYGERKDANRPEQASEMMSRMQQAVADVRRARDAVTALPLVDGSHIGLQGTSLGGFVSSTAGGLDGAFDSVFIMLAGGDLHGVVQNGDRDAQKMRDKLAREGLSGDALKELLYRVEPNRVAHRLNPQTTWLFSGRTDTVVPLDNAISLAKAARLSAEHHIILAADHYSGIVFIPEMIQRVHDEIQGLQAAAERAASEQQPIQIDSN